MVAVSVTATHGGYQFSGFTGTLSGTTTPQNLTINGLAAVTATFLTGSAGPDLNTYYTYDLLNNVTQVTMPRATGTQTRTFNYNNTAYLQSATNPENGTVTYTYTTAGNLAGKTDAKGQKVVYTYDGYNRLWQVQRTPRREPSRTSASASPTTTTSFRLQELNTPGDAGRAWTTGMRLPTARAARGARFPLNSPSATATPKAAW
jgi:YD repeat-containing protein